MTNWRGSAPTSISWTRTTMIFASVSTTRSGRGKGAATRLRARADYSFEATIDPLLDVFERARTGYFARPHRERSHFAARRIHLIHFNTSPDPRTVVRGLVRRLLAPPAAIGASPAGRLRRGPPRRARAMAQPRRAVEGENSCATAAQRSRVRRTRGSDAAAADEARAGTAVKTRRAREVCASVPAVRTRNDRHAR